MTSPTREDILKRLLVAKHLLAASTGQLTPYSDATSVAKMILVSHDAAELGAAAIASHVQVPDLHERLSLMDYPSRIDRKTGTPFPGTDFLRQLNAARIGFKHHGNLPDPVSWHRVVENTWDWFDQWCQTYLGVLLDRIDLAQLLANASVLALYEGAKKFAEERQYREALENLGLAMFHVLAAVPGLAWPPPVGPAAGRKNTNTNPALMLTVFGVRPSDFLRLQDFLPRVSYSYRSTPPGPTLEWDRGLGHAGNWTRENVRFCLDTFLDLALKVQHAPPVPMAIQYSIIFHDVITPSGDTADLFEYLYEGTTLLFRKIVGRNTVRVLRAGEKLRGSLFPSTEEAGPPGGGLAAALGPPQEPTIETATVLGIWLEEERQMLYVERATVHVTAEPIDNPLVRELCPHLFSN